MKIKRQHDEQSAAPVKRPKEAPIYEVTTRGFHAGTISPPISWKDHIQTSISGPCTHNGSKYPWPFIGLAQAFGLTLQHWRGMLSPRLCEKVDLNFNQCIAITRTSALLNFNHCIAKPRTSALHVPATPSRFSRAQKPILTCAFQAQDQNFNLCIPSKSQL